MIKGKIDRANFVQSSSRDTQILAIKSIESLK